MIAVSFQVLGKEWLLRVLKKKKYAKKRGKDSVAITIAYKRRIDVHESGTDVETIIHELVHAYFHELCLDSCQEISVGDLEEIYAEMMSKFGREILNLADAIHLEIINLTGQQMAPPPSVFPIIHFSDQTCVDKSPCGNKDPDSTVTNDFAEVTCEECKHILKKDLN